MRAISRIPPVMARRGRRLLVAVFLIAGVLIGCGVKGPPLPAHQPPLPAVVDLTYRLETDTVLLDWRLDGALSTGRARRAAFVVQRSRTGLDEPACDTCPLIFDTVTTVPYADGPDGHFSIDLRVARGYRYAFKVFLKIGAAVGKSAQPVAFDLPQDGATPQTESS